ncbi:hypothetical protein FNU79_03155 [Deinococcus detaillensis]|uniref:Uncharacterized protein n=1 Tax=Deinococcus detaillensis TaxID=2592048 RepID=A0A553V529_9DEIO|nr:hypothetical protein [Deinococcus detaillensis]TSA87494.1 hypothetical protein FNU79_03155 [Deinococcus detaillensis]
MPATRSPGGWLLLGWSILLGAALWLPAAAQTAPSKPDTVIRGLIPEVISLRSPADGQIDFAITPQNYPPATFPARYLAPLKSFAVLSSSPKPWTVQMEIVANADTRGRVPDLKNVSYRINGGGWLPVVATPQVVLSGTSPTLGWQPITLEFVLDLQGGELDEESFNVRFTATVLP